MTPLEIYKTALEQIANGGTNPGDRAKAGRIAREALERWLTSPIPQNQEQTTMSEALADRLRDEAEGIACGGYAATPQTTTDLQALLLDAAEVISLMGGELEEARAELRWPWQFPPIDMAEAEVLALHKWVKDPEEYGADEAIETIDALRLNLGHIRREMKGAEAQVSQLREALEKTFAILESFGDLAHDSEAHDAREATRLALSIGGRED